MKPVTLDGAIYVMIAFMGALASALGSDDAAKYIDPAPLWYVKNAATAIAAGLLALKMYRSTSYANFVANGKTPPPPAAPPANPPPPTPPTPPTP